MEEGSEITNFVLNPKKLKDQICETLLQMETVRQGIDRAKRNIQIHFDAMKRNHLKLTEKSARKYSKAIIESYKYESVDHKRARTDFLECLNSDETREKYSLNQKPFIDSSGKPINLIRYWNENYMIKQFRDDGWSTVEVEDARAYTSLRRRYFSRAPANAIVEGGPVDIDDFGALKCPTEGKGTPVPIFGKIIDAFRDRNKNCMKVLNYFKSVVSNNSHPCSKKAKLDFAKAEKRVSELLEREQNHGVSNIVKKEKARLGRLRIAKDKLIDPPQTSIQADKEIAEEFDRFRSSSCLRL